MGASMPCAALSGIAGTRVSAPLSLMEAAPTKVTYELEVPTRPPMGRLLLQALQ
jgi:hypothetical protein